MEKETAYKKLVEKRKNYKFPEGLVNPSKVDNGLYDQKTHIGPWCRWQGNLNADIMLIGQDWGTVKYYRETKGAHKDNTPTNTSLRILFNEIGIDIGTPSKPNHEAPCFFTNVILGLKEGEEMAGKIKAQWIKENAIEFLKPNIDIIKPKIIITLGKKAYDAMAHIYGLRNDPMKKLVTQNPIKLYDGILLFAMYHCGGLGMVNRKLLLQIEDWKKIKNYL